MADKKIERPQKLWRPLKHEVTALMDEAHCRESGNELREGWAPLMGSQELAKK